MSYAGYLINNSFTDWANSPISTTVSTHPIDELPFPAVTVCPPEGSNTGLNYDLMKADEGSLTLEDRREIQNFTKYLFEDKEGKAFTEELIELINQKNLPALYNSENVQNVDVGRAGFYLEKDTFHYDTSMTSGRLTSPWHSQIPEEGAASKPWSNRYTINFPSNQHKWLGNGTLTLKLEFSKDEGNADLVEIGSVTFTHYTLKKNWTAAEEHCVSKGGHLASVLSRVENRAMVASCTAYSGCDTWWMGGRRTANGTFEWSDGEEWGFVDLSKREDECVMYYKGRYSLHGQLQTAMFCETERSFMCVNRNMKRMNETGSYEILYDSGNITNITLWWKHCGKGKEDMMSSEFSLEWKTEGAERESTHRIERGPNLFTQIANSIVENEQQTVPKSEHELWDLFRRAKLEYLSKELFDCKDGQTYNDQMLIYISYRYGTTLTICELLGSCSGTFDAEPRHIQNITEEHLLLGFQLYSYLLSCPTSAAHFATARGDKYKLTDTKLSAMKEALKLSNFTFNLLNNSSPRTIIQATRNILQNRAVAQNMDLFKQFYHKLDEKLNFTEGQVAIALSTDRELNEMLKSNNLPHIEKHEEALKECLDKKQCDQVKSLIRGLNKNELIQEVSNNPVHLITRSTAEPSPSSFIPFCAFASTMLGNKISNFSFPVCTAFTPTLMEDQLCYQLNISALEGLPKSDLGQNKGLALLIDLGEMKEKSVKRPISSPRLGLPKKYNNHSVTFHPDFEGNFQDTWSATLFIDMLKVRTFFLDKSQTIALDSLKRSVVSENFMALDAAIRKCNPDTKKDCRNTNFLQKAKDTCKCTAFSTYQSTKEQVICLHHIISHFTIFCSWIFASQSN